MKTRVKFFSLVTCMLLICSLLLTGCGSGNTGNAGNAGASIEGTHSALTVSTMSIEQGLLIFAGADTITIFSDNTFVLTSRADTYYSADGGQSVSNQGIQLTNLCGTFEVVDDNADIGERTIKITEVTYVQFNGEDLVPGEEYELSGGGMTIPYSFESYAESWTGKEIILSSDALLTVVQ